MKIFVTGASGWIGSAVVPELLGAGHEVVGLARSEESAQRLESAGALVQRGDLDDPDGFACDWHILMKGAIILAAVGDLEAAHRAQKMARRLIEAHKPAAE